MPKYTSQSQEKKGNYWGSKPIDQILAWLEAKRGWHKKRAILLGCEADPNGWDDAISELLEEQYIEIQGEGDSALYKAVE